MKLLFICLDRMPNRLPTGLVTLTVYFATFLSVTEETIRPLVNLWCMECFTEERRQKFGPISSWDVSQVTDMCFLFFDQRTFNDSLALWNVSRVKTMKSMFYMASAFNQPLTSWNVSRVKNMQFMFYYAGEFNQPLDDWDVSQVTNMYRMFANASEFNQPLNKWDVCSVTQNGEMFYNASEFNQSLDNWFVAEGKDMFIHSKAPPFNKLPEKIKELRKRIRELEAAAAAI